MFLFILLFYCYGSFLPCKLLSADSCINRAASCLSVILSVKFLLDLSFLLLCILIFFLISIHLNRSIFQKPDLTLAHPRSIPGNLGNQFLNGLKLQSSFLKFLNIHKQLNIISGVVSVSKLISSDPQIQFFLSLIHISEPTRRS